MRLFGIVTSGETVQNSHIFRYFFEKKINGTKNNSVIDNTRSKLRD